MNEEEIRLWREAAAFAARAHEGQVRKDGRTPYVAHPFRVAMIVRHVFGCEDGVCLAAALLHDTIEDTGVDFDDLESLFGSQIAETVAALSKDMRVREDERERRYDEQLIAADWRAKVIKLADVYDNLSDMTARTDDPDPAQMVDRCRRALKIAETESAANEVLRRGIEVVRAAIER